jgi:hypothetical protein
MTNAVIQKAPLKPLDSLEQGANSISTSKAALVVGKTALSCLGQVAQTQGSQILSSIGQRAGNLGNLFGAMASGYAINDFGESLSSTVGGALALRREVNASNLLNLFSGISFTTSEALGALAFVAGRGVVALGGAAAAIELAGMATLALGSALQMIKGFVELRQLNREIAGQAGGATPDQLQKMSGLKWGIGRMGILAAFGAVGIGSALTIPTVALGVASTALITTFFGLDLFRKLQNQGQPGSRDSVPNDQLVGSKLYRDRLDSADAGNPTREAHAARERAAEAAGEFFSSIPGLKGVQGFIRGGTDAVAMAAELAGQEGVAQAVSAAGGQIAGGMLPQAEVVANATKLVKVLQDERETGSAKAASVGIAGGKVIADAAKLAGTLTKFKVIDVAGEILRPLDVVGKAADFTSSLLTITKGPKPEPDLTGLSHAAEVRATAARAKSWKVIGDYAKLTQTIMGLAPIVLSAFGRTAPGLALRAAGTVAGLTMGVARTTEHFIKKAGRFSAEPEAVIRVG